MAGLNLVLSFGILILVVWTNRTVLRLEEKQDLQANQTSVTHEIMLQIYRYLGLAKTP
jgi:hypothetical protein